ncbi:MAG TPA: RNA polymerase sigma factor [Tepidisphaeraceae bacterium]|nr:RNA polymerase sigma factor [Tepidisphaeraceae bacterium]
MARSEAHRRTYEQWVRAFAPELYRYAHRLAGDRQIAEDLTQETFVEAWRSVEKQKHEGRARAWLFQILRFRYSHFLRDTRRHRQVQRLTDHADEYPPAATQLPLDRLADQDEIQMALGTLSPLVRDTFLMVFSEGLTCRQTAESLDIPMGTVLSRLDTARRALRAALTKAASSATKSTAVVSSNSPAPRHGGSVSS